MIVGGQDVGMGWQKPIAVGERQLPLAVEQKLELPQSLLVEHVDWQPLIDTDQATNEAIDTTIAAPAQWARLSLPPLVAAIRRPETSDITRDARVFMSLFLLSASPSAPRQHPPSSEPMVSDILRVW
jgi:hypothetical protein